MKIYTSCKRLIDNIIFNDYRIETKYLGLYRILFCLFTFVFYGIPDYSWIIDSPDYLFNPPHISITGLLDGFPHPYFFIFANILIFLLYIILFFGWKTKYTSLALFFTLLICQSFSFSFGKIDHNIVWLIIPLIMAFSGWGNTYSVDAVLKNKDTVNSWAISLMALVLGFAMFTASVPKIYSGWLSLDSQAALSHVVYNYLLWDRKALLFNEVIAIDNKAFWEIADYLTVIFEFGFLVAFLKPQVFKIFVGAAVIFHISVFLTLDIIFLTNLLTYLLFINWTILDPLLKSRLVSRITRKVFRPYNLVISILAITLYALYETISKQALIVPSILDQLLSILDLELTRLTKTIILFAIALIFVVASVIKTFKQRDSKVNLNVISKSSQKIENVA